MEPITLTLLIKLGLSLFLIIGGFIALIIGNKLYRSGVGLNKDGSKVEYEEVKIHLKTVGSVVMATSVAWGGLGYLAIPKYSKSSSGVEVTLSPLNHTDKIKSPLMVVNGVNDPRVYTVKENVSIAYEVQEKLLTICGEVGAQKKLSAEESNSELSCKVLIY